MIAKRIDAAVFNDQSINLLGRVSREQLLEQINQVAADEALNEIERHVMLGGGRQNTLDGSDDVYRGINQGAVNVEQINFERRNQAGCGLSPPIKPGRALGIGVGATEPPSGLVGFWLR